MPTAFANSRCDRLGEAVHFALDQPAVNTLAPQQRVWRPVLYDLSQLKHDDAVEIAHGREPMRNGDHRAPVHQTIERLADRLL